MTTPFDRPLYGYRFVLTEHGDTLPAVAARELGDASRWFEIIVLNQMIYPYLTDDPKAVTTGVYLNGGYITIPASTPSADTNDPGSVFGQDILLTDGNLSFEDGDIALVSGLQNLNQAITNALNTDQGELSYHPGYGTLIRRIIGAMNGPAAALLAANYAKAAVASDPRIDSVLSATGSVVGDAIAVVVESQTVQGTTSTGVSY